jgi:histidinol dehydrogenase
MIKIIAKGSAKHPEVKKLCGRGSAPTPEIAQKVRSILDDVQKHGIKAAEKYAKQFDGLTGRLKLTQREIDAAASKLPERIKRDLRAAIRNVRDYHTHQMEISWSVKTKEGSRIGQKIRPLKRVGIYVPGGSGSYPSTLIMNAVPAMVAGVKDIVAVTPVKNTLDPAVAYCLQVLTITEVYKIGGAQAIGLLAYGGGAVQPVDKIVGPANVWASYAKKEVFGTVDIDMIAGPSEILVICDESADPDWVAADLLSQAEHGSGYEAAVCITNDIAHAKMIAECVEMQVESSPKKQQLKQTLKNYGRIFVVKDWKDAVELSDRIAPEHLEIITLNAHEIAEEIQNAGAIFIGPWSSEPVGDYYAGPNHVLPTNGTARFNSPLGVYDFLKRTSIIEYSDVAMQKNGERIARIATQEGFIHHAAAVLKRLD